MKNLTATVFLVLAFISSVSAPAFTQTADAAADPANTSPNDAERTATGNATNNETELHVTTFSGAYGKAFEMAVVSTFEAERNQRLQRSTHTTGAEALAALQSSKQPLDIVELDYASLNAACDSGLLVKNTPEEDRKASERRSKSKRKKKKKNPNVLPGATHPCGTASLRWSGVTIYNKEKYKKKAPSGLWDLLNTKRFPGKRALVTNPEYLFETILIAEGVKPYRVYRTLSSDKGVRRVLRRLNKLSRHITWVDSYAEAVDLVSSGKAGMGQGFNGRVFLENTRGSDIAILWDGQIYDTNYYAIAQRSNAKQDAAAFISFATEPRQLAKHAGEVAYGPLKKQALSLMQKHPRFDVALKPFTPTHAANGKRRLRRDAAWWAENRERIQTAFDAWRAERAQ